jgi:serine/tyrosine/threonine adenylyltransferase
LDADANRFNLQAEPYLHRAATALLARRDVEALRLLADHAIARHYPDAAQAERPYRSFLEAVIARQADLIPRWLLVGFIHGVMNTDNTTIAGETIDFGPCAFLDDYDPAAVFSSIDQHGRYSYANQPRIAQWNLARLAEALLPLLAEDEDSAVEYAEEALSAFGPRFEAVFHAGLRRKIGLFREEDDDLELIQALLSAMAQNGADFTLTFRGLCDAAADSSGDQAVRRLFKDPSAVDDWAARWRLRLAKEPHDAKARSTAMKAVNPVYIPRNHRVEAAIQAGLKDDLRPFNELVELLSNPFVDQPDFAKYADPPQPHERVLRTFCGT